MKKVFALFLILSIAGLFSINGSALTAGSNYDNITTVNNASFAVKSGFPVQTYAQGGGSWWPESPSTMVANLDGDRTYEIMSSGFGNLSLYMWNSDSSIQRGWPANNDYFFSFPAAGNLIGNPDQLEVVSAFDHSAIVAYDAYGNPLPGWPRFSNWGHVAPALADVNGDGYDEIFVDLDDGYLYGISRDGSDLPGWPVSCVSQALHTPAIADIDMNGDLEIIVASDTVSGNVLCAFHHTGAPVAGFPVIFSGDSFVYPVIGDVDNDQQPEIIVVKRTVFGMITLGIYSGSGMVERDITVPGMVVYGAYVALGDLNNDTIPEIIVGDDHYGCCDDNLLYAINGNGDVLPGWPVRIPLLDGVGSVSEKPIFVADIDGDQQQDVIASRGYTLAYDRFGNLLPGFPIPAVTWAVEDVDLDGRNELITSGDILDTSDGVVFPDVISVYETTGNNHGKIEWGQFGGGPQHRHVYPVPQLQPLEKTEGLSNVLYLPTIVVDHLQGPGIYGNVTYENFPASQIPLELCMFDGSNSITIRTAVTDIHGDYYLTNIGGLPLGNQYYIRYQNHAPGYVSQFITRPIDNYIQGDPLGITDFDLANFSLLEPAEGSTVSLPYTFTANDRTSLPVDRYSYVLYDPSSGIAYIERPYQGAGITLNSLPPGFTTGVTYLWTFWAISPENAIGMPGEMRHITFIGNELNPSSKPEEQSWTMVPEYILNELNNLIKSHNFR